MPEYLDEKLISYSKSDVYPFHMPGHKRRDLAFVNPYSIDITEIDGFDNLHHPEEIIKEAQERAASLYGSLDSYYLVNGSTCGLLAAIHGVTEKGDRVLVARNCHKAVYNAILLRELQVDYLYPQECSCGIQGQISPLDVERKLAENKKYKAIVITSPTYDGVVSDIKSIAEKAHKYGIPLIVDEAHGAHLGFSERFPEEAGKLGADLVIMSLHKTLPSFTQTALLHRFSDLVDKEKIRKYLGIFETSSPSYIFMAGMDQCLRFVKEDGAYAFSKYAKRLDDFYQRVADLRYLSVLRKSDLNWKEAFDFDEGKLVIMSLLPELSGPTLHKVLLQDYHLQMEMVAGRYVLAMTTVMDTSEGLERLAKALHEIDERLDKKLSPITKERVKNRAYAFDSVMQPYLELTAKMTIAQAEACEYKEVCFEDGIGKIAKDYVFLYPPGIPLMVPGEEITESLVKALRWCEGKGLTIEGIPKQGWLNVVN